MSASAALCGSLCLLALGASPAIGFRKVEGSFGSFNGADSVGFESNGDVWVSDHGQGENTPGQEGIYEYSPFPSKLLLSAPNTYNPWQYYILDLQLAVDQATNDVFVTQANGGEVDIFSENTPSHPCGKNDAHEQETFCLLSKWTDINGATGGAAAEAGIHVAIDNSNTLSNGRVYLSLTSPENDVEALDAEQRPVQFPATASYIHGNRLTGTPSGPFGEVQNVAVDSEGNLYVTDAGKGVIDEYNSTGTFLRSFPGGAGVGIDPTNGNVLVGSSPVAEYDSSGNFLGNLNASASGAPAVTPQGYAYIPNGGVEIFGPTAPLPKITYGPVSDPTTTSGKLNAKVNPAEGGDVIECKFEYGASVGTYTLGTVPCESSGQPLPYSSTTEVSATLSGLTTGKTYHYRVVVKNASGTKYGEDQAYTPQQVLGLNTSEATAVTESAATLNGSFVGNGEETHYYFEWGPTAEYGHQSAGPPGDDGGAPSAGEEKKLSAEISGLSVYSTYHYRIVASNGQGTSYGEDHTFTTQPGIPSGREPSVTEVHADKVEFHAEINPNGADTKVHFEFVDASEYQKSGWETATKTSPEVDVGMGKVYQNVSSLANGIGLVGGTLYHYRAVGTNVAGSGTEAEGTFRTFAFTPSYNDPCPNAHVRQQTGAAPLLDCRAYELVSAESTNGYDVESNLVAGESPVGNYPEAESPSGEPEVLYGIHDGGIPGTGFPTNRGVDPYVATRGANGWTTKYVGIPANNAYAKGPFSSSLLEASADLNSFAFGGSEICSPCFADGSTGEPITLPSGELVQGMAGAFAQPNAQPAGFIGKALSAEGTHFIFGSTSRFEPEAEEGKISIYDRDLTTGETHVVSKTPAGANIPCVVSCSSDGIGELDTSKDGSRIVVGQLLSESEGARYWHLYMNIGDQSKTIDLTPGTTHGVLFDGMTADGSKVFFTTVDQLTNEDTDHSADIYEAEISGESVTLHLISQGSEGTGNAEDCDPSANTEHEHWNTTGSESNCGAVAVGGGGGVASGDGTIYFLSPEKLDGSENGVQNAPNLYVSRPGQAPHFVATLESSANAPLPAPIHPYLRKFGIFESISGVAIDAATGDVYGFDNGERSGGVQKFESSGRAVTSFGSGGRLTVGGVYGFYNLPCGIAVDNSSSPNHGDLYVPNFLGGTVERYNSNGAHLSSIPVSLPSAIAVDPANGDIYVASYFGGVVIFNTEGNQIGEFSVEAVHNPTGIAVNSSGTVYVVNGGGLFGAEGSTEMYSSAGMDLGQLDSNPSRGVAVDPSDNAVYVDEGTQVSEFNSSGEPIGAPIGTGLLGNSISLAAASGYLDISNPSETDIDSYGQPIIPTDPSVDNPLVVDSVGSPGARKTGDFQVSPSGDDAVFTSTLSLTGYENGGHSEIFRYDAPSETLACVSCNPTTEKATGSATLAGNGLSLSNDGRVFFNTTEGLADSDLNHLEDAYEWEPQGFKLEVENKVVPGASCETAGGCIGLISTGHSSYPSSLLGISANGTNAYFFTRDTLVSSDSNGNRVKLYDARSLGGYPQSPAEIPCQASDECHGPSTKAPAEPIIESISGTPVGNGSGSTPTACRAGFVRKHGTCVKKPRRKHHRKHHRAHRRRAH